MTKLYCTLIFTFTIFIISCKPAERSNPLDPALEGRILNVPNIFPTIQEAINNAKDGDIVVVENGIYTEDDNKNISFLGKAITVISENGADSTIIDCNHSGRGFIFENEEDSLSVLDGFTITNGEATDSSGGGIYLHNSNPTILNVIIRNNKASSHGGGMFLSFSSPTMTNVTITNNELSGNYSTAVVGGGMYLNNSSPTMTNVIITDNTALDGGGGLFLYGSSPTMTNVTITNNELSKVLSDGGGMYLDNSSPTMTNVIITDNTALDGGGGLFLYNSSPSMTNLTISNNTAVSAGGGMVLLNASPIMTNVIITKNKLSGDYWFGGGGMFISSSSPTMTNMTISDNTANVDGGGISLYDSPLTTFLNSILWNNSPNDIISNGSDPIATITYSNIQQGVFYGEGNKEEEPLFVDPENSDYHLQESSPCIDAGNPDPQYNDTDESRNDMGAYGGPGGNR